MLCGEQDVGARRPRACNARWQSGRRDWNAVLERATNDARPPPFSFDSLGRAPHARKLQSIEVHLCGFVRHTFICRLHIPCRNLPKATCRSSKSANVANATEGSQCKHQSVLFDALWEREEPKRRTPHSQKRFQLAEAGLHARSGVELIVDTRTAVRAVYCRGPNRCADQTVYVAPGGSLCLQAW